MIKIDLNGKWSLTVGDVSTAADVPCTDYSALLKAGKIPDPFYGTNEKDVRWVAEKDSVFSRVFTASDELLNCASVLLRAEMLDTLAEIEINGASVCKSRNAHIPRNVEIKPYLEKGENEIKIEFDSPLKYIEKKQKERPAPNASMGVDGVPHIRKPQCHFGWDWGPILPVSGILRSVDVTGFKTARIKEFDVKQIHNQDKSVTLEITTAAEIYSDCEAKLSLISPDGEKLAASQKAEKKNKFEFKIANPKLWYTRDLSETDSQPLYSLELEIGDDEKKKRVGLRTLKLNREADEAGQNFRFEINGIPIFAKGANWIPADSFIDRFDKEKLAKFIGAAKYSNFNMIRVWGGGYYESDEFYDACDEAGILIWQDLGFACAPYPFFDDDFLSSVKEEIAANVKRLKHHPSLALWCGNNEIEMMTIGWRLYSEFVKYEKIFFYDVLPPLLESLDGVTPFIPGSPCGSKGFLKQVNADSDGDTHLWHVWHGLQPLTYYRKRFTRFCSEFGLESLPVMKTIESFAKPEDYNLKSDVFMSHQKCDSGNNKMLYYISTRFRIPKSFEDTVYLSQIIQSECVKDATLHWRRNRGVCNGSLYWQFNDCWPVTSWSGIDYYGRYKALQYRAKDFMKPVCLSLKDEGASVDFYVLNDTMRDKSLTLSYKLSDLSGNEIKSEFTAVDCRAVSSESYLSREFKTELRKYKGRAVLFAYLTENGEIVDEKTVLFKPEKILALKKPEFEVDVKTKDGKAFITLSCDGFARYARLELPFDTIFSDNYFDMIKGVEKTIVCGDGGMSAKELKSALRITTVADVKAKGGAFSDFLTRTKIALIPINIANRIYYHTV